MNETPSIETRDPSSAQDHPDLGARMRASLFALVLLSILGLGVSGYLTVQHMRIEAGSTARSACSINESLNCDLVNSSVYSEIFGIPIALLGALFYSAVLGLGVTALGLRSLPPRDLVAHVTVGATGALAYSIFLAAVSKLVIGAWCLFCISLYGINALLFAVAIWGAGVGPVTALQRIARQLAALRSRPALAVALVGLGLAGAAGFAYYETRRQQDLEEQRVARVAEVEKLLGQFMRIAPREVPVRGDEPARGPEDAPVTIVEWFDFQCGHCKKMARHLDELVAERPGDVRLVMKHLPLGQPCNRFLDGDMHPQSCRATAAALCAQEQDRYWEMHDALFFYQHEVDEDRIDAIVEDLGLDRPAFESCLDAPRTAERIDREVTEALLDLGITGTPSLFIEGRPALDGFPGRGDELGFLNPAIDWLIAGAPAPPDAPPDAPPAESEAP